MDSEAFYQSKNLIPHVNSSCKTRVKILTAIISIIKSAAMMHLQFVSVRHLISLMALSKHVFYQSFS